MSKKIAILGNVLICQAMHNGGKFIYITVRSANKVGKYLPVMPRIPSISVIVNVSYTSERKMRITFTKPVLCWTVIVEATLDFRFERTTVLNSWRCPIFKLGLGVLIPDIFTAEQHIARLFCQAAGVLFPILGKGPFLKFFFDTDCISAQLDILFNRTSNADKNVTA